MSSNTGEQQTFSNADANEPHTQVSVREDDVRSVLSENVQLRENLKGTISSLEEQNISVEAEIYNLKQENITLWANVKRENAESQKIKKEIEQLEAEYKLERVKRDEISNKELSIRLVEDELKNHVKRVFSDKNTGELEAIKNYKAKEDIKLELERFNMQYDSLEKQILQNRKEIIDEFNDSLQENNKDEDRLMKLAHDIAFQKNVVMQLILEYEGVTKEINKKSKILSESRKNSQFIKERSAVVQSKIIATEKANKEAALEKDKRIAELEKGNSAIEVMIEKVSNSMKQLNSEKIDVMNKEEMINIANKSINERIVSLYEKISTMSESEAGLQDEIESLKKSIEPLSEVEAQHEELTAGLQKMQNDVADLSSLISSYNSKLEELQAEHVDLQQSLDLMKDQSNEVKTETEQAKQLYYEVASSTAQETEQRDAEMKELRETLDDILAIIKERENQLLEAKALDEEMSEQLANTKSLIQKFNGEKEDIEEKLEVLDKKSKVLEKSLLDEKTSQQICIDDKLDEIKQLTSNIESIGNLSGKIQALERDYEELVKEKADDLEKFKAIKSKAEIEMKTFLQEKNKLKLSLERQYEVNENELLERKNKYINQIAEIKKRLEISNTKRETLAEKLSRYLNIQETLKKDCAHCERTMTGIKKALSVTKRDIYNALFQEKK
ncbi:hypothetical protein LSTR_LSTR002159 [Laodelphax striatellus]|uniref:Uncharacterized protein n=2 Tax=Laodelphax striatellus TaxID=195883 RepID=A0A482XQ37_LAOST|nr:hypothetical protein LSTR_LSTR002159 [Laodelphax striatellus]